MPSTGEQRLAGSETESIVDRLEAATADLESVEARIADRGEESVNEVADAYHEAASLLDTYVDRASGTGREEFQSYIELEGKFGSLVESLPEDMAHREAFEEAWEAIDKRRLDESDFAEATAALEPAKAVADLLDERERANEELTAARRAATDRLDAVRSELERIDDLEELAAVDIDAPIDDLEEPIESYNAGVREAFDDYLHHASAREVFAFLERTANYPLVPFSSPPEHLREYVETAPEGEETVPTLLEYAEYSRSKLDHYVSDAGELKRRVGTEVTYLSGIDAEPLSVQWPPPPAEELRWRIKELLPLVSRVADEDVVTALRTVRELSRSAEYDRLRQIARARTVLSESERRLIADGRLEDERAALEEERGRLEELLDR